MITLTLPFSKTHLLKAASLSALLFLSSCAAPPESIAPSYISEMSYMNYSCAQLAQEQNRLVAALSTASDAQRSARAGDIAGVIFLGFPTATLSGGNMAAEVGRLKGELQALQKAAILKGCSLPVVPDPTAKKKKS